MNSHHASDQQPDEQAEEQADRQPDLDQRLDQRRQQQLAPPYAALTPDVVLNSVDAVGLRTTGTLLALNSYENRVFQLGMEGEDDRPSFVVAKFYRPGRWSDAQILEEHALVAALAAAEIPAVPALVLNGATLHHADGFRFSVFPRQGGRVPNLDDDEVLEWIGRYLGRIHAMGSSAPYHARPALDVQTFGVEPRAFLLEGSWLPGELREVYAGVSQQALDGVRRAFDRAGDVHTLRLHGDVHEGNVLWTDSATSTGPHFVDFDDSRMGPAVQDFWMLLGRERDEQLQRLASLVAGYEDFAECNRRELHLIEALRTLRLIHYSAWIASRWHDPAFPAAFPWFDTQRYWEERVLELREQVAAMDEAPLVV
jgi:Ser/Thr protein kinase RdoA (MazF antagonist)